MGVSCGQNQRSVNASLFGVEHSQIQHGADALGGTLGGVVGGASEETGSILLALTDDAVGLVETVSTRYLGDVKYLKAQKGITLVSGHVQPHGIACGV